MQPSFLSCSVLFRCRGRMADDRAFLIVFTAVAVFMSLNVDRHPPVHTSWPVDGSPHDCQVMLPFSVHLSSGHAVMGSGISYFICIDTIIIVVQ